MVAVVDGDLDKRAGAGINESKEQFRNSHTLSHTTCIRKTIHTKSRNDVFDAKDQKAWVVGSSGGSSGSSGKRTR
jgi:hypothetical protein